MITSFRTRIRQISRWRRILFRKCRVRLFQEDSSESREEDEQRRRTHFEEVSVQDIRAGLFARSPEREVCERQQTTKITCQKEPKKISYLQPLGGCEYSDYTCSEHCGCNLIPARDKRIVDRHHFHYRDYQNTVQWGSLTEPIRKEKLSIAEFYMSCARDEDRRTGYRTYCVVIGLELVAPPPAERCGCNLQKRGSQACDGD